MKNKTIMTIRTKKKQKIVFPMMFDEEKISSKNIVETTQISRSDIFQIKN